MDICATLDRDTLADCLPDATASYRVYGAVFFDRDIGGSDGWEATGCRLEAVTLGDLELTRAQAIAAFGADTVAHWEACELQEVNEREAA
jgi:hypothetical protein